MIFCIKGMETWYIPKRSIFTILGFFGVISFYATRVNMSIAMVAMVNHTRDTSLNESYQYAACQHLIRNETKETEVHFTGTKYNWDPETQGFILSSFYYGYVATQLPGGILCERLGSKWLFGGGVLITTSLYLFVPLAASWGVTAFAAIRILEGLGEGLTFPALTFAISNWAPKFERSRISAIINAGIPIGNILGSPISGFLSSSELFGGWPSTFYLFGGIGCIWFVFWCLLEYETPEQHPTISKEELLYIQKSKTEKPQKSPIPWKDIFSSMPVWAVIVAHFGHNYSFLMFLTMLPTYFKTILHFDIQLNGSISALPYAVQTVSTLVASYIADKLRESNKLSITTIRKLCNSIGLMGPGLCCLGIIASGCHSTQIVVLLCVAMFLNGFVYSGYNVTHVDMSPDFAGVLFGITNSISNTAGILSPMIVGLLTASGATLENWNRVFYITTAVYFSTAIFYAIFASAELQPWGDAKNNADTKKNKIPMGERIYFVESTEK